ncbi:alpha/beta fold hydrolase [Gryllotalpicola protaetiae]|uniref:Alpha/beta hydrolase n=1 Tax=Gryllotalpicola protaetiae TaxID=2419771 RepID=A0A387BTI6_9MICO|nr:alpha/beta hydrolase [Gryllotalpicola protaetiae]AYG04380.1 alpha/beta hydrolase [Gryllotalpicola protaetiae]
MTQTIDEFAYLADEAAEVGADPVVPDVRRVTADAPGGELSALLWGVEPRLTLLHGAGLNAHTWDATLLRLRRDALAVDLPGHGDSAWRDDFDYGARTNAAAVAAALDALAPGVPQAVIGQSLGGSTAIALLEARPELVASLVLVDVSPGLRPADASSVRDFLAGPLVFDSREQIVELAVASGIGSDRVRLARGVVLNTRVRDDGKVVFKHHLAAPPAGASLDTDFSGLWAPLEASDVPVLLVHGSSGFLPPDVVAEFHARVPRAALVELDAGHNVQEQQPAALADAITAFLAA